MNLNYVVLICFYVGCLFGDTFQTNEHEKFNSVNTDHSIQVTEALPTISPTSTLITTVPTSPSTLPPTTQPPTTPTPSPSPTTPSSSPTTPSSSPTTPSSSPTTPSSSPTTTSSYPTTSLPTIPTPTPTPFSVWTITNETSNIACIVAKMDITLKVNHGKENATFIANPKTAKAQGKCGETQTLEIILPSVNNTYGSLAFMFKEQDKKYFISSLVMNISRLNFSVQDTENVTLYQTGKNTSYSCPSSELHFNPDNETSVKLNMNDIHIEAFRLTNSTKFSSANHCSNGEVPDMVPIIVGLALAALVIIVVIGYFIGRMRSQARGYLSM